MGTSAVVVILVSERIVYLIPHRIWFLRYRIEVPVNS